MAVPVARVHLAMAHAALPALLPTPPKSMMVPLLPTPPCVVVLPNPKSSPPRTSRADADERWNDARKNAVKASSSSSKTCRADADERWDARKTKATGPPAPPPPPPSSSGANRSPGSGKSTGHGRASACERWDSNKKTSPTSSSSSSSSSSSCNGPASRSASGERMDGNKRRPVNRASSAERWDAHKKRPRPPHADEVDDDGQSSTGSSVVTELDTPLPQAFYAGPGFIASLEPSMLPMPSLFTRKVGSIAAYGQCHGRSNRR